MVNYVVKNKPVESGAVVEEEEGDAEGRNNSEI